MNWNIITPIHKFRYDGKTLTSTFLSKWGSALFIIPCITLCISCGNDEPATSTVTPEEKPNIENHILWDNLWKSTPLTHDNSIRSSAYKTIQVQADNCSALTFTEYMNATAAVKNSLQKSHLILDGYDYAFDKVINGIKNDIPTEGEVLIWHIYNMGYVFKTTKGAFALDIFHKRAEELAPYIDFYGITHKHLDHKSEALALKMAILGKPVISNFSIGGSDISYISDKEADYKVGSFEIHTFITNHNNSSSNVPVTVFKVDCGKDANNTVIIHSGDSNFRPEQFSTVKNTHVDIYIPRYSQTTGGENQIIGNVFNPKYVLISHILELSHEDVNSSRWPLTYGLSRASTINCAHTYMPFWGDKMSYKNGILK